MDCKSVKRVPMTVTDPSLQGIADYYNSHDPVVFPHVNEVADMEVTGLAISCEHCGTTIPTEELHGEINDYPETTEIRFVAMCVGCRYAITNTVRARADGSMIFLKDNDWVVRDAPRGSLWSRIVSVLGL